MLCQRPRWVIAFVFLCIGTSGCVFDDSVKKIEQNTSTVSSETNVKQADSTVGKAGNDQKSNKPPSKQQEVAFPLQIQNNNPHQNAVPQQKRKLPGILKAALIFLFCFAIYYFVLRYFFFKSLEKAEKEAQEKRNRERKKKKTSGPANKFVRFP